MQSLFEWDFNDSPKYKITPIVKRVADELAPGLENVEFAIELAGGVVDKQEKLDAIIEKAAP